MMRKILIPLFIAMVLMLSFTSCEPVLEILGLSEGDIDADLAITNVELLKSGDELTGLRITFENRGGEDTTTQYAVVFSTDTTVSLTNDEEIYRANLTIAAGGQKVVDVDMDNDINPYINQNNITVESNTYFLGVFVDPSDLIIEANETNNFLTSTNSFVYGAGSTSISGTITIDGEAPVGLALSIGLWSSNADYPDSPSYSFAPSVTGSTVTYTIDNVVPDTYIIAATIDVNNNRYLDEGDFAGSYGNIDPFSGAPNAIVTEAGSNIFNFTVAEQTGTGGQTVTLSGNLQLMADLQEDIDGDKNPTAVSSGGYAIYYGFFAGNIQNWEASTAFDPADLTVSTQINDNYDAATGSSYGYSLDVPQGAYGAIVAFLDANANGLMDLDAVEGFPLEPFSVYPFTTGEEGGGPYSIYFNNDETIDLMFYDITSFSGPPMVTISGQVDLPPDLYYGNDLGDAFPVFSNTYPVYYGFYSGDINDFQPIGDVTPDDLAYWYQEDVYYDAGTGSTRSYGLEVEEGQFGVVFAWVDVNRNGSWDFAPLVGDIGGFPIEPFSIFPIDTEGVGAYSQNFYFDEPNADLSFFDFTTFGDGGGGIYDIGFDSADGSVFWTLDNYMDYQGGDYYFQFVLKENWNAAGQYWENSGAIWDGPGPLQVTVQNYSNYQINLFNYVTLAPGDFRIEIALYHISAIDEMDYREWGANGFYMPEGQVADDGYEPDNGPGEAWDIAINENQVRTLTTGDADWIRFYADAGIALHIETYSVVGGFDVDTVIELFDPDVYFLQMDDDGGSDQWYSALDFVPEMSGYYYVLVRGLNSTYIGDYGVTVEPADGLIDVTIQ